MKAYVCDRCGKTIRFPCDYVHFQETESTMSDPFPDPDWVHGFDLCEDCRRKLEAWLREEPEA